jgi:hypothetical protein
LFPRFDAVKMGLHRTREQDVTDPKIKEPCKKKGRRGKRDTAGDTPPRTVFRFFCGDFFETRGTQNPVVVFRDAFPAEMSLAFGAAGHCFARGMIQTPAGDERWHEKAG